MGRFEGWPLCFSDKNLDVGWWCVYDVRLKLVLCGGVTTYMSPGKFFVLWKLYWLSLSPTHFPYSPSIVKIFSGTITDIKWLDLLFHQQWYPRVKRSLFLSSSESKRDAQIVRSIFPDEGACLSFQKSPWIWIKKKLPLWQNQIFSSLQRKRDQKHIYCVCSHATKILTKSNISFLHN